MRAAFIFGSSFHVCTSSTSSFPSSSVLSFTFSFLLLLVVHLSTPPSLFLPFQRADWKISLYFWKHTPSLSIPVNKTHTKRDFGASCNRNTQFMPLYMCVNNGRRDSRPVFVLCGPLSHCDAAWDCERQRDIETHGERETTSLLSVCVWLFCVLCES